MTRAQHGGPLLRGYRKATPPAHIKHPAALFLVLFLMAKDATHPATARGL